VVSFHWEVGYASSEEVPAGAAAPGVATSCEAIVGGPSLSINQAHIRIGERMGVVPDTLRGWLTQSRRCAFT
jgi:hypothetical protein